MPRKGWIKLHHGLLDNPIWEEKPFDEGHAWVDLLLLAESEEKDTEIAGVQIHQKPGGVYWSKKDLMARWGWGRKKLNNVLSRWEAAGMVKVEVHRNVHRNVHRGVTEITVEKWGFFQGRASKRNTERNTEKCILLKKNKEGDGERLSRRPAKKKMERRLNPDTGAWEVTVVD